MNTTICRYNELELLINKEIEKIIIIDKRKNKIDIKMENYSKTCNIEYKDDILEVYIKKGINEDITFIVQGKIDDNMYFKNISNLVRYGMVVESVWGRNDLNEETVNNHIRSKGINNGQNIYYQVYSVVEGLKKCETEYAIKVRADEYYDNWEKYIKKIREERNKIITTNIFFRNPKNFAYHISDHIIGGRKESMEKMFYSCKENLDKKKQLVIANGNIPEQLLTISYLNELNVDIRKEKAREHTIRYFYIVDINDFEDFVVTYTVSGSPRKRHWVNGIDDLKNHRVIDLRIIEDIM